MNETIYIVLRMDSAGLGHLSFWELTYFPSQSKCHRRPCQLQEVVKVSNSVGRAFVLHQGLKALWSSHSGGGAGDTALVKGLAALRSETQCQAETRAGGKPGGSTPALASLRATTQWPRQQTRGTCSTQAMACFLAKEEAAQLQNPTFPSPSSPRTLAWLSQVHSQDCGGRDTLDAALQ